MENIKTHTREMWNERYRSNKNPFKKGKLLYAIGMEDGIFVYQKLEVLRSEVRIGYSYKGQFISSMTYFCQPLDDTFIHNETWRVEQNVYGTIEEPLYETSNMYDAGAYLEVYATKKEAKNRLDEHIKALRILKNIMNKKN